MSLSHQATEYLKNLRDLFLGVVNPNGGVDVNLQDQTTRSIDAYMVQLEGTRSALTVEAVPGEQTFTLTDSTGFVDTGPIGINSGTGEFYFGQQVGAAAGNVITVDSPIDGTFPIDSEAIVLNKNMAVDGSVTTQIFRFGPGGGGNTIDLTRFAAYIQAATAMDDAKFGGGDPLTYGLVFRTNRLGVLNNLWNVKTNGEMALVCASDFDYTTKAPAGSFGARARNSYAGPEKHGVAIRLSEGEFIEILVQDDLTDQEIFYMMPQGHFLD